MCFTAIGGIIVHLGYIGQRYDQMKEAGKQFPVLPSDYQIVIQEHDYVITQGNRIVGIVHQTGELDSLIMDDNL